MQDKSVTLVVTSCGRPDLLKNTLNSFERLNTYPLARKILIEDSASSKMNAFLHKHYGNYFDILFFNDPKLGQLKSIDKAYKEVNTPYLFHCEDDWLFVKPGIIESSFLMLDRDPKIINIWLRGVTEENAHAMEGTTLEFANQIKYRRVLHGDRGFYRGFTLNPTLKRMRDYQLIGSYAALGSEEAIAEEYQKLGFYAISFEDIYIKHIGQGRHVPLPGDKWLRSTKHRVRNRLRRWFSK